jgi:hypothetical protein
MDKKKLKSNNDSQLITVGTRCHVLKTRPVWLFERSTLLDAKP